MCIIPKPDLVAVRVNDDRTAPFIFLQTISVEACLYFTVIRINRSAFGLDHSQRHPVVVP